MKLGSFTFIMLFAINAAAIYSDDSKCPSPVQSPFQTSDHYDIFPMDTDEIGIFGYLANDHKNMMEDGAQSLMNTNLVDGACSGQDSLVIYMEPSEYKDSDCSFHGDTLYKVALIKVDGTEFNIDDAMKGAANWVSDTVSSDYDMCPKSCSFASTTRMKVVEEGLKVESFMRCVEKRARKVNRVHTAILREWQCDPSHNNQT